MIKIHRVHIKRFRSINNLELCVNQENNFITICGENNAGKTNILRAIDLFFHPEKYERMNDVPNNKRVSGGGTAYPNITIDFSLSGDETYRITRDFYLNDLRGTSGESIKQENNNRTTISLSEKAIKAFLDNVHFFFVESVNISFPALINTLIDDIYDIEYGDSRLKGLKGDLKGYFDSYTQGLLTVLKDLSDEINPIFREYKDNWGVDFDLGIDVKKFRDLITDQIMFYISDGSNKNIAGKGSGLQKLAYILMHARIIEKIKPGRAVFLLIDEPDVFLHQGLQKKLQQHLKSLSQKSQIFITTHSPTFIDSYKLENVFLLDLEITKGKAYSRAGGEKYDLLDTKVVNITQFDGSKKIKEYLGIENRDYELLDRFNIIVEGETDQSYLTELANFFGLELPQILSAGGADNIPQRLDFYKSYYEDNEEIAPCILVLLDNDNKGREVAKRIKPNKYLPVNVQVRFVPNFLGESPSVDNLANITTNHEIEDFIYPKLLCDLINRLLRKKKMKIINVNKVCSQIEMPAFKNRGILHAVDSEKNARNPNDGQKINFIASDQASPGMKQSLARLLKIQGDPVLSKILQEESSKYPAVEEFLRLLANPTNFISPEDTASK
ncbi:DNA replication and repair protein RecF [Leptolyngbya sp. NIES-3755]|nr:DNA replication and repair protein RecF [Leptolyngbya sp. NIES-3755]